MCVDMSVSLSFCWFKETLFFPDFEASRVLESYVNEWMDEWMNE